MRADAVKNRADLVEFIETLRVDLRERPALWTLAQLDDYLAALDVTLTREQADRLDAVSAPTLGVPHGVAAEVRERFVGSDFDLAPVPVA